MAGIGSISSTTSTLAADQATDKQAKADATKAAAQLVIDQKAKATAEVIKNDQEAVTATAAASAKADAKVQADTSETGGVNITI